MNKRLLIGTLMYGISSSILGDLKNMGIEVSCCSNEPQVFMQEISRTHYDGIVVSMIHEDESVYSLLRQIRSISKEICIIVSLYTGAERIRSRCIISGADKCIVMPVSPMEMSMMICAAIDNKERFPYMGEIALILRDSGFPQNFMGFYYLCIAVELCLTSPGAMGAISKNIYPVIAKRMNTSNTLVERSMRHYSGIIYERRTELPGVENMSREELSNKELISIAADIANGVLTAAKAADDSEKVTER